MPRNKKDKKPKKHRVTSCSSTSESSAASNGDGLQRSVRKNGRFINPWPNWKSPSAGETVKVYVFTKNNSQIPSKQELDETLPVVHPDVDLLKQPVEGGIRTTWLGHSSLLIQMDNINILTDPIFSQRSSPVQFIGPKRYRDCPCSVHDLPRIHAVVISHSHYDHLDHNTVQVLNARFGADVRWFVPLGLASWMHDARCENVIEMDWWDENCIPEYPQVKFVFTPAMHYSNRSATDTNKVLWGSWCVLGPWHKFFFAGDTGYCHAFEQIGNKFGPFHLAAIPIGSYEPRWYQRTSHVNPDEAVQIHQDVKARKSVAIHWGTFPMGHEFYLEPREKLAEAVAEGNLSPSDFITLKHGETKLFGDNYNSVD